jgi:hypothetical protein
MAEQRRRRATMGQRAQDMRGGLLVPATSMDDETWPLALLPAQVRRQWSDEQTEACRRLARGC